MFFWNHYWDAYKKFILCKRNIYYVFKDVSKIFSIYEVRPLTYSVLVVLWVMWLHCRMNLDTNNIRRILDVTSKNITTLTHMSTNIKKLFVHIRHKECTRFSVTYILYSSQQYRFFLDLWVPLLKIEHLFTTFILLVLKASMICR